MRKKHCRAAHLINLITWSSADHFICPGNSLQLFWSLFTFHPKLTPNGLWMNCMKSSIGRKLYTQRLHSLWQATFTKATAGECIPDFTNANLRKVLPKYHQHVNFQTRGENILDHAYSPYSHAYKARPRPAFGKSDHSSVLLLPCYRQKLKREKPVIRSIQRWTEQSDEALCDCFQTT